MLRVQLTFLLLCHLLDFIIYMDNLIHYLVR